MEKHTAITYKSFSHVFLAFENNIFPTYFVSLWGLPQHHIRKYDEAPFLWCLHLPPPSINLSRLYTLDVCNERYWKTEKKMKKNKGKERPMVIKLNHDSNPKTIKNPRTLFLLQIIKPQVICLGQIEPILWIINIKRYGHFNFTEWGLWLPQILHQIFFKIYFDSKASARRETAAGGNQPS